MHCVGKLQLSGVGTKFRVKDEVKVRFGRRLTATTQVFISKELNPYFNMAFEDYYFNNVKLTGKQQVIILIL
jgi:lipoate-protein ligase A